MKDLFVHTKLFACLFREKTFVGEEVFSSVVDRKDVPPMLLDSRSLLNSRACDNTILCTTDSLVNMSPADGIAVKWRTHFDNNGHAKFNSVRECASSMHIRNTGRRKSPDKHIQRNNCHCCCSICGGSGDAIVEVNRRSRHSSQSNCDRRNVGDSNQQNLTWLYMIVWLVSVLPYINGLTGEFVHDDLSAITSNPDVTGANPLYQVFLNDYWGKPLSHPLSHKSYRPLTILTFRLTHSLVGLSSAWFHLGNVALHALVCLVYTRLLTRLLSPQAALSPALLFATHPIHTEA
ncbi:protein O-mannosyl-transferase TMTC1, partial [Hyalella azteca]|uniref:Protein O-mannosyl-transferase TMTC1 n=1 Tax=Hyalella azteca TaxID=294128 RepID=A0A8B7NVM1_HYAAZ